MFLSKNPKGIYYLYYKQANGKRTCVSTRSKRKPDALKFLTEFRINKEDEEQRKYISITLEKFRWEYLKYSESFHTYKTTLTYKTTFNMLLKYLGDIQLIDLTHKKIEEYIQFQIRTNSIHSGRKDLINIKASLNWAVQNNYLLENPSKSIKRIIPPQKLPLYYTREDFQKLLDVIDKEDVKDLVIFAVNTGLRQSELLNLQFRQVNFNNRTIILDNQTHITKSKRIRSVPLNETAFNIIQKRNNGREQNVFTIRESGIKQDWIVHNFKKYVLKAKVNPKLHFHSLRHTFASWLVQKGISIYEVSKLLGHADIKTTEIYAHLRSDDLRNAVRVLD
jgi:site-specific recombinase XerD